MDGKAMNLPANHSPAFHGQKWGQQEQTTTNFWSKITDYLAQGKKMHRISA
jgi:hypothetical protein